MSVDENRQRKHSVEPALGASLAALGDLVTRRRLEMKLSLHELAVIIGVEPAVLESIESGSWEADESLRAEISQILQLKLIDKFF